MSPATLEALETAWYAQDFPEVERVALEVLAATPGEAEATGWLGLASYATGKVSAGQKLLAEAFLALARAGEQAGDGDERTRLTWVRHGLANRLTDALGDNPTLGPAAARFIVEGLALEHVPALRRLADEAAGVDPVAAATLLKRALMADPTDPESHYAMARAVARLGKKPNVLKHLEAAIRHGQGLLAVRTLARVEPDFDGFRDDADFAALMDTLPPPGPLRELYQALDRGEPYAAVPLADAALAAGAPRLDVLYPLKEALELLLEAKEGDPLTTRARLDAVAAELARAEAAGEVSAVYRRYCGQG